MKKSLRSLLVGAGLVTVLMIISACSQTTVGGGSNLTVLQVLQKSGDAMKQLKSSHVELQFNSSAQTNPAASATPDATPVASPTPLTAKVTVKGSGDQALPNQMKMDLTTNDGTTISEVLDGDKVYVKNPQGKWYVYDKKDIQGVVGNPLSGVTFDQNTLLGILQHSKITDYGVQSLNGENLRHISAALDRDALKELLQSNPQIASQLGKQNIDTVVDNLKSFTTTVDVWIDETNFYLHRTQIKLDLQGDASKVTPGGPSNLSTTVDTTVDLSKFNDPVTITPPADATPTTDPTVIFGNK